jgi:hypothetical protein
VKTFADGSSFLKAIACCALHRDENARQERGPFMRHYVTRSFLYGVRGLKSTSTIT